MTTDTSIISISVLLHNEIYFLSYDATTMKTSGRYFNGRAIPEKKLFPLCRLLKVNYQLDIDIKYWGEDIHLLGEQIIKEFNKIICN